MSISQYVYKKILFDGVYFLLAVMVEGDESNGLRKASRRFWPSTG